MTNANTHAALILLLPSWPSRETGRQGLVTSPGMSGIPANDRACKRYASDLELLLLGA